MRLVRKSRKKARIEIIPMIDTIFFLLVFFMVATLSMTIQKGLMIDLPKAANGTDNSRMPITLTLTREGRIYFDKEEMASPADLSLMLRTRTGHNNEPLSVVINADRKVEHGRVIEIMDSLKKERAIRLAIAVNPR